jgi:parallel beta-helix repeat protein
MSVVYVSIAGQDSDEGTVQFPFRTLTRALQQARPGGVIQLAPGTYEAGEQFPLKVPAGVTVAGAAKQAVVINGGGSFGAEHVAVVLGDRAQIREVTVTNPQGSGVFTREGAALIVSNRLINCQQHGILALGNAHPFISKNDLTGNGATGLYMGAQTKGEVRQNQFAQTGDGLAIHEQSAPLVIGNQLTNNRCALIITGSARPVLRKNQATASQESGLWLKDRAEPDIGQPQDLGQNKFEGKTYDIRNDAATPLVTAGNHLNPIRVQGQVTYLPSKIPDEAAIPAVLLGNVAPTPLPPSGPPKDNRDPWAGLSLESRFDDLVGHWSAPFVEALAEKNLIKGFLDGTFQPDTQVTRAQFAALVAAAFPATPTTRSPVRFQDVAASFWAANAIRQVQTQGFISGFPDGTFRPDAPLTRVQAVVALVSGLALGSGRSESLLVYGDRAQIPSYAIEPVAAATERQLIVSYPDPTRLRPLVPITRAETSALVHQALVAANKIPRIQSPFIGPANVASPNFTDLPSQHWAKAFIDPLVQKGWLSGFRDGSFQPDAPMTRAQFAALIVGAFDPPPNRPAVRFRDVPDGFWAAAVIQRAYRAQFLSGFPDLTFDPNYPLTKLQALLALVSGLNLQAVAPPTEAANARSLQFYADRADIPSYAIGAISSATQLGLVFNRPVLAELRPNRAASRAEVSAMVYQALVLSRKMPPINSADQVSLS